MLLLGVVWVVAAQACSDVILSPTNQVPGKPAIQAAVSARHLDWYALVSNSSLSWGSKKVYKLQSHVTGAAGLW
jgi:hypothetical protein